MVLLKDIHTDIYWKKCCKSDKSKNSRSKNIVRKPLNACSCTATMGILSVCVSDIGSQGKTETHVEQMDLEEPAPPLDPLNDNAKLTK